jgi:hypothetical protein
MTMTMNPASPTDPGHRHTGLNPTDPLIVQWADLDDDKALDL